MLIDMIGIGLLIPIFPDIIRRFNADSSFVSQYFGYFISVYAFMQFLASPVLGALSDKYGRRSILLISLLGAGLDYILMAYAPNLIILFIGRIISGLTGANMTVATSYIADVSDDSNRAANFGLMGAAFGIGFIIGPMIGGFLGALGPRYPFLGAAALILLNFAFGLFVLPESLPLEKRRHIDFKKLNPFKSVFKILAPSPIVTLVWIYALLTLAGQVHPSNWTLYTEYKFGWSSWEVGLSLAFVGLSIGVSQAVLTRTIIPKFGEPKSVSIGVFFYTLGFLLFALANRGWMMYAIMVIFAFSGVATPALQSMIAKHVPSNEQGELQGSLISISSLTAIFGPLLYTSLFAQFTGNKNIEFPGVAYFTAAMICVVAFCIYLTENRFRRNV